MPGFVLRWSPETWSVGPEVVQQIAFMVQKRRSKILFLTGNEKWGRAWLEVLCLHLAEKDWTSKGLVSSSA